LLEHTYR
jgi:hypothetical protein